MRHRITEDGVVRVYEAGGLRVQEDEIPGSVLREDSSYILREDGSQILREDL